MMACENKAIDLRGNMHECGRVELQRECGLRRRHLVITLWVIAEGCTDNRCLEKLNYVELATEEDGTCEYCSCLGEEYGGYGIWVEE